MMAGAVLGAAAARRPIVIDGFIAGAAALAAVRLGTGGARLLRLRPSLGRARARPPAEGARRRAAARSRTAARRRDRRGARRAAAARRRAAHDRCCRSRRCRCRYRLGRAAPRVGARRARLAPPLPACGERSARSCAPGEGALPQARTRGERPLTPTLSPQAGRGSAHQQAAGPCFASTGKQSRCASCGTSCTPCGSSPFCRSAMRSGSSRTGSCAAPSIFPWSAD